MPTAEFRTYEHWREIILGALVARGNLTTVAPGGVAMTLSGALAQCLDELSYQASNFKLYLNLDTCQGPSLVARAGDIVPGNVVPLPAQAAQASLTFGRMATAGPALVKGGTQVKDSAGNVFATLQDATLPDGVGILPGIAAQALTPGLVGNVAAHALNLFISRPIGIDTVDNPSAAQGGQDQENDDSFRQRIRMAVAGLARSVPSALVSSVLGQQDPISGDTILYAAYNKVPQRTGYGELYISDASGTNQASPTTVTGENLTADLLGPPTHSAQGGETMLVAAHIPVDPDAAYSLTSSTRGALVAGSDYNLEFGSGSFYFTAPLATGEQISANYSYFTGVIALAQTIINGGTYAGTTYPGQVAAGCVVLVRNPQVLREQLAAQLAVGDGYSVTAVQQGVQTAWGNLLNSLGVGQNLVLSELVALAMAVPGVVDVNISQPMSNVLLSPSQLIRPGAILLS